MEQYEFISNIGQSDSDSVSLSHFHFNFEEILERNNFYFNRLENLNINYPRENEEILFRLEENFINLDRDDEISTMESTFDDGSEEEDSLNWLFMLRILI